MSYSTILVLAAFCLWVVPPALLAGSFVERDRELWADDYLAVAVTAGYACLSIGSAALAALGWLTPLALWVGAAAVTTFSIIGLVRKRRYRPAIRLTPKDSLLVFVPVLLAMISMAPLLLSIVQRPDALPGSTPWYYWDLARQTAESEAFPESSIEWGKEVPFLRDYPGFTASTAGLASASTRPTSLAAAHLIRVVSAIGTGIGIWYLSRVLGANRHGAAASIFLIGIASIFALKLMSYRPESAGYMPMLLSAPLVARWLRTNQTILLVAAALGVASLGITHGLTWAIGATLVIAFGLTWLVKSSENTVRTRLFRVGIALGVVFGGWLLPAVLLQTGLSGTGHLESLPTVQDDESDPTWVFSSFGTSVEGTDPPTAAHLAVGAVSRGFVGFPTWVLWAAALLGLGLCLRSAWSGDRQTGDALWVTGLFLAGVALLSLFFSLVWDTYVPRRTGFTRVLQVSVFLVPVWLSVGWSRTPSLRGSGARTTLVTVAVAVWSFGAPILPASAQNQMPDRESLDAQRALALTGSTLTNGYTEGYLSTVLGTSGPLEGRAPYSFPGLLDHAISTLEWTSQFFADPKDSNIDLSPYRNVVVMKERWAWGSARVFPADIEGLEARPDLQVIARHDLWVVFEVAP